MAKIAPFRALRYNLEKIEEPAAVMAPPYDVISPELQEDLYGRSPYNIVRLILGKIEESDTADNNRYSRAAACFAQWQQEQVLLRDEEPGIYLYDEEYQAEGIGRVVRRGFMALTRLEDFASGVVKPHEKTLSGPKTDRLNLTRACGANFSPIFAIYSDPCCVVESLTRNARKHRPDLTVADDDGVRHRLWRVTDAAVIDKARELLDNKPLFIADGHHRYETALNYRNLMREQAGTFTGKELFNFVLMYFANMEDQGMLIFPTHRLVRGLKDFSLPAFLQSLQGCFEIEARELDVADSAGRREAREILRQKGEETHTLAFYAGGSTVYFLSLRQPEIMDRFFDEKASKALRMLDVSILHRLILEDLLHISTEAQERQLNLQYIKNFDEPFTAVRSGDAQLAFLLNATRMSEVRDVANAGEKMPQKSTYFYPKLLTGLVLNKIVAGETVED